MSDEMKLNLRAIVAGMTIFGGFAGAISFANRVENKADQNTTDNARQDGEIKLLSERQQVDHDRLTRIETTMLHIDKNVEEIRQVVKSK